MAANITFVPMGIGQLLRQGRLQVPPNQRSYAWREKHVRNLLEDLHDAISNADTVEDYFLGAIVLIQAPGSSVPSIVDGQQRLATTSIILARMRDYFLQINRTGSARSIEDAFLGHVDPVTEETVSRLQLNDEDNEFFNRTILPTPTIVEENALPAVRQSNRRLLRASNLVADYLIDVLKPSPAERHADILLRWYNFIDTKAHILALYTPDEVSAFRMFETLNDRGLRTSQADILKNYFLSRAAARINEAKTMWNTMAVTIEPLMPSTDDDDGDEEENRIDPLVTYLRHLWVTTHGVTKERELAAQIRTEITSDTRTITFLSDGSRHAQDYIALSSSQHPKWAAYKISTRQYVETLSEHLRVSQIRPLLFAVAMRFPVEEADKAFKLFVSWSVRFLVFGGRGGMLDTQYSRRAQEIGTGQVTNAAELRDKMNAYVPSDTEFEEAFAVARVSRPYLARYYLRALEKTFKGLPQPEYVANEDVTEITLEHYMPLSPGPEWNTTPELAQAAQKFLGNMALVREAQNRELGNRSPSEKRPIIRQSGYALTSMIANYDIWNMDAIRDRQTKLAKLAVRTWSLEI